MATVCFYISNVANTGGEERMCVLLANELQRRGHCVIVVSQNNYWWQKGSFKLIDGIRKYSLKRTLFEWAIARLSFMKEYPVSKYKRILSRSGVQLVIDVDTERSLESVMAADGTGIKIISWEHFCYQRFLSREISKDILDCIVSKIDRVVVLTKADHRHFVEDAGVPESKVCQIYNPSPIEMSGYTSHSERKVLSMGRLEGEKGIDNLLKVWAIVEKDMKDWTLEIVGEGSMSYSLRSQAESLGLKTVVFSPFTSNPREKYAESSLFVLPSNHEGLSLTLLEALNMSLPVVAFDCPNGPKEIVQDEINGYLIKPGDIESFASHLLELMQDSEKRESFSRNALGTVELFKTDIIVSQWEKLILSLVPAKSEK